MCLDLSSTTASVIERVGELCMSLRGVVNLKRLKLPNLISFFHFCGLQIVEAIHAGIGKLSKCDNVLVASRMHLDRDRTFC